MDIELLVVPDCPHAGAASALIQDALRAAGVPGHEVQLTVIADTQTAQRRGFTGSPTFLVDGLDPYDVPAALPALACRLYAGPEGPSGIPPVEPLVIALARAASAERPRT